MGFSGASKTPAVALGRSIRHRPEFYGGIAHLVERDLCKVKVAGSNPVTSTNFGKYNYGANTSNNLNPSSIGRTSNMGL